MKHICLYFQVHQPFRLKQINMLHPEAFDNIFDKELNTNIFQKISTKCYLPTNKLLLKILNDLPEFRIAFSLSGTFMEQLEAYSPATLDSFKKLFDHPSVEVLAETYTHGLTFLNGKKAFKQDVKMHNKKVSQLFNKNPVTFRNTELIYSDLVGEWINELGFKAVLIEGADKILNDRSPNVLYHHPKRESLILLTKNYRLSDDIAFRFGDTTSEIWPLTARKFLTQILNSDSQDQIFNLFMDYETFGEHQSVHTGIFNFLRYLPVLANQNKHITFTTPNEAVTQLKPTESISMPVPVSWADAERDISAWLGNNMQLEARSYINSLKEIVDRCKSPRIFEIYHLLQSSDHYYYMATKSMEDGSIHAYFSPYDSPHDAFVNYMNALTIFELQLNKHLSAG